jgi:hypothetical protein
MRLQLPAEQLAVPDGTPAEIVENNPDSVTFYVASGEHAGYYHYDKQTQKRRIEALS